MTASSDTAWTRYLVGDADASCVAAVDSPDCCTAMLTIARDVIAACARPDITDVTQLRQEVLDAIRGLTTVATLAGPISGAPQATESAGMLGVQNLAARAANLADSLDDIADRLVREALAGQLTITAGPHTGAPYDAVTAAVPLLARASQEAHQLADSAAEAQTALGLREDHRAEVLL